MKRKVFIWVSIHLLKFAYFLSCKIKQFNPILNYLSEYNNVFVEFKLSD